MKIQVLFAIALTLSSAVAASPPYDETTTTISSSHDTSSFSEDATGYDTAASDLSYDEPAAADFDVGDNPTELESSSCGRNERRNDNGRCVCARGYSRNSRGVCREGDNSGGCPANERYNANGRCVCERGFSRNSRGVCRGSAPAPSPRSQCNSYDEPCRSDRDCMQGGFNPCTKCGKYKGTRYYKKCYSEDNMLGDEQIAFVSE
mmetsp:Transcript_3281/g.7285  ORF Transcript_3281/g.7285 Transcript_3281/m.7285 type:complete len:205 (-) Transcript_3281:122-736(-)